MHTKSEKQLRHEALVKMLNGYEQFKDQDGKGRFSIKKESLSSDKVPSLTVNEINAAVVGFTDILNIGGGSIANIDLYQLMQAYLRHPDCRGSINAIVHDAIFKK